MWSASQSVPSALPHPLCVPSPMSGTAEGQGWRRKDCRVPLVQQDRQRLGNIAAVLWIKGTSSVRKPKNHPEAMKLNVTDYIHPQHPPRAGAHQVFAHVRQSCCQGACVQGDECKCQCKNSPCSWSCHAYPGVPRAQHGITQHSTE